MFREELFFLVMTSPVPYSMKVYCKHSDGIRDEPLQHSSRLACPYGRLWNISEWGNV